MIVCVRNPQYPRRDLYRFAVPEFHWYQGDEVAPGRWETPESVLCLTTGNPDFPVRSIQRSQIESIDGRPYTHSLPKPTRTVKIQGSRGEIYTVTVGVENSCTCKGFQFRHTCRHLGMVSNA